MRYSRRLAKWHLGWRALVSLCLLLALARVAWAQEGFVLVRHTADHAGAMATGGDYTLVAALGQAEAGGLGGGDFLLAGGFLTGAPVEPGKPKPPVDPGEPEPMLELYFPRLGK